ncbi:MAG: DUF4124 domain-containing protein [Deltaproteobacteria bacterium]|nr:MAG: DUF4124 domain-containing protein [Deltaproteobacteria bacterium]
MIEVDEYAFVPLYYSQPPYPVILERTMRFITVLLITILGFLPNFNSYAGTIYSWTDKNGVKKFSNTSPEGDVEHFEVIEEMPLLQTDNTNSESGEEEPADVTQEPEIENSTSVFSTIEMQFRPQETENNNIDEEFTIKIQTEKKRLQEEIDRIDKLAVGKNFSLPRKKSMMKDLQDKLELLEKSPEKYFGVSEAK